MNFHVCDSLLEATGRQQELAFSVSSNKELTWYRDPSGGIMNKAVSDATEHRACAEIVAR